MRFMIIVKATQDSEGGIMPEEKLIASMATFHEELVKAGVLLDASGLQPSSKGWRIRYQDGKRSVIDGPFAESKEMVGGFFLLDCESKDQALAIAGQCPAAEWATVEVREVAPVTPGKPEILARVPGQRRSIQ